MNIGNRLLRVILQLEVILLLWEITEAGRVHIYLDEHDSLLIPKQHSELKILNPISYSEKFFSVPPKANKKPLKYVKQSLAFTKLKNDVEKKCCGDKWTLESKDFSLDELIGPVSLPVFPSTQIRGYQNFDDVKPVTEIIEDDLKYDFRTKTHSFK